MEDTVGSWKKKLYADTWAKAGARTSCGPSQLGLKTSSKYWHILSRLAFQKHDVMLQFRPREEYKIERPFSTKHANYATDLSPQGREEKSLCSNLTMQNIFYKPFNHARISNQSELQAVTQARQRERTFLWCWVS